MSQVTTKRTLRLDTPTRKVGASAIAGALTAILVFILNSFVFRDPNGVKITGEIASALTTVLTFLVGYIVPDQEDNTGN